MTPLPLLGAIFIFALCALGVVRVIRLRAAGELTAPQTPEELEARLNLIATDYNGYK